MWYWVTGQNIMVGLITTYNVISIEPSKVDVDSQSFVLLSLFMINLPYLDSLNDVEIYNALKNYSRL